MLTPVPPTECMRARESASAQLDGELSELESVRLDAHLRDCLACREYAAAAALVAFELRCADLQHPAVAMFTVPRPRRTRIPASAAVAAAVMLAAGSLLVGESIRGARSQDAASASAAAAHAHVTPVARRRELLSLLPPADRARIDLHGPTRWAS
ncbi:MAG TPA: zf-HC2 domain-containing protein [Gaiellaceae bacterium]|nr:zf-HC2 domain-containing protein [Gaiellaceae bacterium]